MAAASLTELGHASTLPEVAALDDTKPEVRVELSHRLTPGITLHVFSLPSRCRPFIIPGGHIEVQFGPELDPIYGARSLSENDRRLSFTPCSVKSSNATGNLSLFILAGNGRVTQMISAPRLDTVLMGTLVGSGGGFPPEAFQNTHNTLCIASGTGIAPFLTLAESGRVMNDMHLFYSLRGSEFQLFEHILDQNLLHLSSWKSVNVYVTAGTEDTVYVGGKSSKWWQEKFTDFTAKSGPTLKLHTGRMSLATFKGLFTLGSKHVLFCGGKPFEWQVKMWFLDSMRVFTTG